MSSANRLIRANPRLSASELRIAADLLDYFLEHFSSPGHGFFLFYSILFLLSHTPIPN